MAVTEFGAPKIVIKQKGVFPLADVLRETRGWFNKYKYFFEEKKHKFRKDEREVEMSGKKKLNEYVKYLIEVAIICTDLADVEVMRNKKKVRMQKGRIVVEITGSMELDWQGRFKGNAFLQFLQDIYHRYIAGHTIDEEWLGKLVIQMTNLQKTINKAVEVEAV